MTGPLSSLARSRLTFGQLYHAKPGILWLAGAQGIPFLVNYPHVRNKMTVHTNHLDANGFKRKDAIGNVPLPTFKKEDGRDAAYRFANEGNENTWRIDADGLNPGLGRINVSRHPLGFAAAPGPWLACSAGPFVRPSWPIIPGAQLPIAQCPCLSCPPRVSVVGKLPLLEVCLCGFSILWASDLTDSERGEN